MPEISKNWREKPYNVNLTAQIEDFAVQYRQVPVSLLHLGHAESGFSPTGTPLGLLLQLWHLVLEGLESSIPCPMSTSLAGKGRLVGQVCTPPQASLHAGS